jgi:L-ascorbate metabolism protein UlaG (beta-lactamase superfamily)
MKWGRPDLGRYAGLFAVAAADRSSPVAVTFLGVSTLLFDAADGQLLTDGYFSRPGLGAVALKRIAPDRARVTAALSRAGVAASRLGAVIPVHTHFDHALDSALVAELTGARLVGGASAAHLGHGHGLPPEQVTVVEDGETVTAGGFQVTFVRSAHCPPDRYPGAITRAVRPPVRASAYRCGDAWSLLVSHPGSGRTALVQGSAGYHHGALDGRRAQVAYLGVGQLGLRPEPYIEQYWAQTVRAVGAQRVVLTHWDDFFRPLDRPLRALPYAGDDLTTTMRVLTRLAERDRVTVQFPTVWRREDPWAATTAGC